MTNKDDRLRRLLDDASHALDDLHDLYRIVGEPGAERYAPAEEAASRRFRERIDHDYIPFDGYVEISVSDDQMQVVADLIPPGEGQAPIDLDGVREQLYANNVVSGIDWDTLQDAVFRCNTERTELRDLVVARGLSPRPEVPDHLVLEQEVSKPLPLNRDDSDRVDYRMESPFVLVKNGDVLARTEPARTGAPGETVTGRVLPYATERVSAPKPGANTRRDGHAVVAAIDGRFEADADSFWVSEVLEITSDVDYRTGHIDFPGDVLIHGEIKDGFKVRAGGSVYCATTMDASEIIAEGDLTVRRGLIGRKTGTVKVGGNVHVKFIENCYVEAGGTVSVDVGILHSAVYAGDRVEVGVRGIVVGGEIHAQNGVSLTHVGTDTGAPTEIYCGTDFRVEQKLEWIRDKTVSLAEKRQAVELELKRATGDTSALEQLNEKLSEAIRRMNESAQTLVFQLDKNDSATIRARGDVMPGTYVEICHVSHLVDRKRSRVQFRLDKGSGKIVEE